MCGDSTCEWAHFSLGFVFSGTSGFFFSGILGIEFCIAPFSRLFSRFIGLWPALNDLLLVTVCFLVLKSFYFFCSDDLEKI